MSDKLFFDSIRYRYNIKVFFSIRYDKIRYEGLWSPWWGQRWQVLEAGQDGREQEEREARGEEFGPPSPGRTAAGSVRRL